MEFEFDPKKSKSNEAKHGIDFTTAQQLWEDPDRIEIPARTSDETRSLVIARLDDKLWSAVVTMRGEKMRLISVRRARREEQELYES